LVIIQNSSEPQSESKIISSSVNEIKVGFNVKNQIHSVTNAIASKDLPGEEWRKKKKLKRDFVNSGKLTERIIRETIGN
jgi:hypothetical protein